MDSQDQYLSNFIGSKYWAISKPMVRAFGASKSIWITRLFEQQRELIKRGVIKEGEYFFLSQEKIYEETGISTERQTYMIKSFKEKGILYVKEHMGWPPKNYYHIDGVKMVEFICSANQKKEKLVKLDTCEDEDEDRDIGTREDRDIGTRETRRYNNNIFNNNNKINNCNKLQLLPPDGKPSKGQLSEFIYLKENEPQTFMACEEIFDYWSQFGQPLTIPTKNLSNPTKTLQEAFIIIWKELKRLPKEKIKEAIYLYWEMLVDTDTYDLNCEDPLHLVDICNFFKFNNFLKKKQLSAKSNNPAKEIKSWYWECAQGVGHLEKYKRKSNVNGQFQKIEDKYPEITEEFRDTWKAKVAKDKWYVMAEKNNDELFKKATAFLMEFVDKYGGKIGYDGSLPFHEDVYGLSTYGYIEKPRTLIYDFIAAIDMATEGIDDSIKITPAWLSTPAQASRLLKYYKFHGCLSTEGGDDED